MRTSHLRAGLAAGALIASISAHSAESCQTVNLAVPATTEGLYVNLVTGQSGTSEASVPGFDVDIYAAASTNPSGQLRFYWGPSSTGGAGVAVTGDVYALLAPGDLIGPASLYTRAAFTGDTSAWQAGAVGYLGLRFRDERDGGIKYGWMLLGTTAPLGFPATISGWCFEDSGAEIRIPLPGSVFANGFES